MFRRLFRLRNRSQFRRRFARRLAPEALEDRSLMAATVLGEALTISGSDALLESQRSAGSVALGPDGGTLAAFHGRMIVDQRMAGDDREIFVRRLSESGTQLGNVIRVNEITRGDQSGPIIDSDSSGNFLVAWQGRGAADLHGIFARRFLADGSAAGSQFRVNQNSQGFQSNPDLAMSADGRGVVVWQGPGTGDVDGIWLRRIGTNGQPVGADVLVNTTTANEQSAPAVTVDDAGNVVVTWSSRSANGDDWDIFLQRFNANGDRQGTETRVNTTTVGSQHDSAVDVNGVGEFIVGWNSFSQDGDGWGVFAQRFDAAGARMGSEQRVNTSTPGHQRDIAVVLAEAGEYLAAWSQGLPDGSGWEVQARTFDAEGTGDGDVFTVNRGTTGPNSGDQRFPDVVLDEDGISLIAFQRSVDLRSTTLQGQRYQVEVEPPENVSPVITEVPNQTLAGGQSLDLVVTATDANRRDELTFILDPEQSPAGATITRVDNRSARIRWTPTSADRNRNVPFRVIVDDNGVPTPGSDASIFTVSVQNAVPVVDVNGSAAAGNDGTATLPVGETEAAITTPQLIITDADQTELSSAAVRIAQILNVGLESLDVTIPNGTIITKSFNAGTGLLELTGTATREQYQQVLRTLVYRNTADTRTGSSRRVEITVNDGTSTSAVANVVVSLGAANSNPSLAALSNVTLLGGSPLHIALDGEDADNDNLTFTVTSSNPSLVAPTVLTGNRSLRLNVTNFGEMVFELFEDRAPRATQQIIALAQSGFYEDIIFHRVVDDFVLQAGDPTGTGSGGSTRPDFRDQFHFDLQHNRTGILSMAKTTDDTNNSQFFITEGPARHLDFNHTIFGQLVEGESVREAISEVPVNSSDRPLTDVVIESATVFTDEENGVVMLKAAEGASGTATITVTVSDGRGGTASRQFQVNVTPDTINGAPFLADIPAVQTNVNTATTFQLIGRDVEANPVFYLDEAALRTQGLFVPQAADPNLTYAVNLTTGLVTVTPRNGITGTFRITVAAAASATGLNSTSPIDYEVVTVTVGPSAPQ